MVIITTKNDNNNNNNTINDSSNNHDQFAKQHSNRYCTASLPHPHIPSLITDRQTDLRLGNVPSPNVTTLSASLSVPLTQTVVLVRQVLPAPAYLTPTASHRYYKA